MMTMNDVLMKFFKLPPGLRMVLAVMGFGSLAGILYYAAPVLKTAEGRKWLLIVGGIGLVVFCIIWLIRRFIFGRKSAALGNALTQGPTRGDIAEQEHILRDKFRAKLVELKRTGLSVYKLPWFVLMGEPGCGKTASLIHSGLDFPLGKDEVPGFGGTRNYNWWFTNEAVILDTAGRIAFHEEGTTDKPEWEFFLRLLKSNRPRCPINGIVIALPADRLLKDTAEERTQKAGVLRERLRQIQHALGVRFPTFVLVTKMDLVGGFSEYFEEVRVDLAQRNQMVGWSRPGEFQEPYDPGAFSETFDGVYQRLREWSMRYLQRKATEQELGMVVTFPESLRELKQPLQDYVGTIFQKSPLVEPPFFRGFYFTSAVQEGAPIFSVFTKSRAGHAVAERPTRAVDSKAFFIHDFYVRKVFPEHGLVFRSAKHVATNRRLRRLVWAGLTGMAVVLGTLFTFGAVNIYDLVVSPRKDCEKAAQTIQKGEGTYETLPDSVALATELRKHHDKFNRGYAGLFARMLFVFADIDEPRAYVRDIHGGYVLRTIVGPIVKQAERQFAAVKPSDLNDPEARERFLAALSAYTRWYGQLVTDRAKTPMTSEEAAARAADVEKLLSFVAPGAKFAPDAVAQTRLALEPLAGHAIFATDVLERGLTADRGAMNATILKGITDLEGYWHPWTDITAAGADVRIRYWVDFLNAIRAISTRYGDALALRTEFKAAADAGSRGEAEGPEKFAAVGKRLRDLLVGLDDIDNFDIKIEPTSLVGAYKALRDFLESRDVPLDERSGTILRVRQVAKLLGQQWADDFNRIRTPLEDGIRRANAGEGSPPGRIFAALDDASDRLSQKMSAHISTLITSLGIPGENEPLDYYVQQQLVDVTENPTSGPAAATRNARPIRIGRLSLGPANKEVKQYLTDIHGAASPLEDLKTRLTRLPDWPALLSAGATPTSGARGVAAIVATVNTTATEKRLSPENRNDLLVKELKIRDFWQPLELGELAAEVARGKEYTGRSFVIAQMTVAARKTSSSPDMPGLARLMPKFDEAVPGVLPFERHRYNGGVAAPPPAAKPKPEVKPEPAKQPEPPPQDDDPLAPRRKPTVEPAKKPDEPKTESQPQDVLARGQQARNAALLVRYHTRSMLAATAREYLKVREIVAEISGGKDLVAALDAAFKAYVAGYYRDWSRVYRTPTEFFDEKTLGFLERCQSGLEWPAYVKELDDNGAELTRNVAARADSLVREAVLFYGEFNEQNDRDQQAWDAIRKFGTEAEVAPNFLPGELRALVASVRDESKPDAVFGGALSTAFAEFTATVKTLGPEPNPKANLPDLGALSKNLVYRGALDADRFPPARVLRDIAEYGNVLLAHRVDGLIAAAFAKHSGKYPLSSGGVTTVPPTEFLDFLAEIARLRSEYGEFRKKLHGSGDDAAETAMRLCEDWESFVYGGDAARRRSKQAAPLEVSVTVVKAEGALNAGSNYNTFKLQLPLLRNGQPAGEIQFNVRGQDLPVGDVFENIGQNLKLQYQWSLTVSGGTFQPLKATVTDRNPGSSFPEQLTQSWQMPADPWAVLILLGMNAKTADNQFWRVPIRMDAQGKTIGFDLGLRFDRRFPGVITPYGGPGPRPTMTKASAYLK